MKTIIKVATSMGYGWGNPIPRKLYGITGVVNVRIDSNANEVLVDHTDEVTESQITRAINELGYDTK